MATTIITKYGSGAPTASDVVRGELAVDTENKRLYTEDSGGSVVELGTNPAANVTFGDDVKAIFGAGSDLQIYHDGTHNFIEGANAGNIYIRNQLDDGDVIIQSDDGLGGIANYVQADGSNGEVRLFHYGSEKLNTTSTGIDVTGTVTADGLTVSNATGSTLIIDTLGGSNADSVLNFRENGVDRASLYWDGADNDLYLETTAGDIALMPSGNVGIGTTSPTRELEVTGTGNVYIKVTAPTATDSTALELVNTGETWTIRNDDTNSDALEFGTSGGTHLAIDTSGNTTFKANNSAVGPIVTLENTATAVNGQAWGSIHFDSNDTSTSASGTRASIVGTSTSFNGDGNLDFYTAPDNGTNTFAMRIDSSGDVSIGDVSAEGAKLHIRTANATTYNAASASGADGVNLIVHNDDPTADTTAGVILRTQVSGSFADARINNIGVSQNNSAMTFHTEGSGTVAERMRIDSSGSLLVGTTSFPSGTATTGSGFGWTSSGYKVQNYDNAGSIAMNFLNATSYVSGTVNFMTFRVNGSTKGSITSNGTTTAYNTSSDQRLKDNIVDAPSASDDIDAIQVRSFDWKADGSHQKYGMVAQELVTVAPEAVSQPEDPEEMMGVDYSKLVPMMLKEIQSLRARVAQLEGAN
jgi:hypothetical protein